MKSWIQKESMISKLKMDYPDTILLINDDPDIRSVMADFISPGSNEYPNGKG